MSADQCVVISATTGQYHDIALATGQYRIYTHARRFDLRHRYKYIYRMVDYSRILKAFFHDNNTIMSSDRLNIVYREYYSLVHMQLSLTVTKTKNGYGQKCEGLIPCH